MVNNITGNVSRDKLNNIAKKLCILVTGVFILMMLTAGTAFAAAPTFSGQAPYATINGPSVFGLEMSQSDRVMVTLQDADRDIVTSSIIMSIDGQTVTPSLISPIFYGYSVNYTPMIPWADNSYHTVIVSCTDSTGSPVSNTWSFSKVSPPVVSNILPERLSDTLNDSNSVDISFHINDNSDGIDRASIQIQIDNGNWVAPNVVMSNNNKDAAVTYKAANLTQGKHQFKIKATDTHGTSIPAIFNDGSGAGWQFYWHYNGATPPGYALGVPINLTPETYYQALGDFNFFLTAFDPNGFNDTYKPSLNVFYPNKSYPVATTTNSSRITINPVSYTINKNEETISALLPIGGSMPDGPGYAITYSSSNPRPVGYEGLYLFQPTVRNSKGESIIFNITPYQVKLITGYPAASEIYPEPGTMVIQPSAPQVSVRITDPGAGASGPLFDPTMKMTENETTLGTTKTLLSPTLDYRMTTNTAPVQGFHSITASFTDKALNPGSAQIDYYYKTMTGTGPAFTSIYPMDLSADNVAAKGYGTLTPDAEGNVSISVKVKDTNLISQNDTMAIFTGTGEGVPFTRTFNYGTDQSTATLMYTFKPPVLDSLYNFNLTVSDQTYVTSNLTNYQFKIVSTSTSGTQNNNSEPVSQTSDTSSTTTDAPSSDIYDFAISNGSIGTNNGTLDTTNLPAQMPVTGSGNIGLCRTCHNKGGTPAGDFKKIHFLDNPYIYRHEQRCWRCHDDLQLKYPNNAPRSKCALCHGILGFTEDLGYVPPGGKYWFDANGDWDYNHGFSSQWSYLDRGDSSKYALNAPREGLDCVYCHQNPKAAAENTPVAEHNLDTAHSIDFGGEGCSSCHSSILTREHGKSTAVDKDHNNSSINCNTCHNSTRTDIKAAIKNYTQLGNWNFTGDVLGSGNIATTVYSSPEYSIPGKKLTSGTLSISTNDVSYWTLKAYYNGGWKVVYSTHIGSNQSSYELVQQNPWWEGTVSWVTGDGSVSYERTQPQPGMSEWKNVNIVFPQPAEKIKYEFTPDGITTRGNFRAIAKFTNYAAGLTPQDPVVTCTSCHSKSNHSALHTGSLDSACQTCHQGALDKEHLLNTKTQSKTLICDTCHANTSKSVSRTMASNNLSCTGCHSTGHKLTFVEKVPADIPLYSGINWSTPMEASLFAGEATVPAGYDTGQVVISKRRADISVNDIWSFYNQQLMTGQWVLNTGAPSANATYFSAEFTKANRAVTVNCFNTQLSNGLGQPTPSGYRIELWYK